MAEQSALILVVDDQEASRFVKTSLLRRAGFRVKEAGTGRDALDVASATSPDAILLDVHLPDISGLEVCRQLRRAHGEPVQILHISATALTDADRVRGLDSGADAYLTEPVGPDVLVATVRALLRVQAVKRELSAALERERAARLAADEANRVKEEFLATLSHELRTPLNTIMGWLWQLRRAADDEALRGRALDSMERATRLQLQLISDLLDVSRAAKGKLQLEMDDVQLHAIAAAAVDDVRREADAKHIEFDVRLEPIQITADPGRLQQILGNLIGNAVQYTPEHGAILVTTEREGQHAIVTVSDNGAGIDPDALPHIFDRFRQAEDASSSGHRGLGLGLTIVRELVHLHGGTVEARSAGIGRGSTFVVRLPRARRADT